MSDSADGGGAEVAFRATVRAAQGLGHETKEYVGDHSRNPLSYVFSLRHARAFGRVLKEFQPDVVHLHNFYHYLSPSVLWALRRHRRAVPHLKVVFTAHDYHLICPNSGLQHFVNGDARNYDPTAPRFRLVDRFDGRSAVHSTMKLLQHLVGYRILGLRREIDAILSPSRFLAAVFHAAGVSAQITVVRNPVDLSDAPTTAATDRRGFVFLGRLAPEKGLAEFIDAVCASGHDIELDIYGTGPDADRISESLVGWQARGLGEHIRLKGHLPHSEVPQTLSRYRALVFCSTWLENAPISIVEAAAAGLGLVVLRGGGGEEMALLARTQHLYEPGDPHSLVSALRAAQSDAETNAVVKPEVFSTAAYQAALAAAYARKP